MFIFDAGEIKKKILGMRIQRCENCRAQTSQHIAEVGHYVTAMDKAILPYKKKFLIICQKCNAAREIDKQEVKKLLSHSDHTVESYNEDFDYQKTRSSGQKFCIHCGNKVRNDAKFCNSCGKTLPDKDIKKY
ncbi:MAG: zinc ribbon domain-containing protein [Firmicutes bacterium]|nr:zinc ribbon domain-containing protein [Bacillota bacterium]